MHMKRFLTIAIALFSIAVAVATPADSNCRRRRAVRHDARLCPAGRLRQVRGQPPGHLRWDHNQAGRLHGDSDCRARRCRNSC